MWRRKKSIYHVHGGEECMGKDYNTENFITDFSNVYASDLLSSEQGGEFTEHFLWKLVNILLHYIRKTFDEETKILDFQHPHQLLEGLDGFNLQLSDQPEPLEQLLVDCRDTLKYGVKAGHPRFSNQLSSGLDNVGLAGEWLTGTANTNMFTYEISPVFIVMEKILLKKMHEIVGWGETDADGIFSPGGSISNLYSILEAHYKKFPEIKTKGMAVLPHIVLFVSEHGLTPLYVSAMAGTTVYGAFDPLESIVDVSELHNLWMHGDSVWGGGLLMSKNHSYNLQGIERTNSVTWNPHKLMDVPLHCSVFLIREKGTSGFEVQINTFMELAYYLSMILKKKENLEFVFDGEIAPKIKALMIEG